MTPDDRKLLSIEAMMDQERQAAMDHGRKIEVSQVELLALANLAKYGLYHALIELGAGNDTTVLECASELREAIKQLDGPYVPGTVPTLIKTCAAILGGERLGAYVLEE